jgi:biopolymer transport protein ExbD
MRLRRRQDSAFEETSINLTPLIDVVFVVLIIFILIAPILETDQVDLATAAPTPNKQNAMTPENGALAIHVHADNTIWLQGKRVSEEQLVHQLKELKKRSQGKTPQLFHDKKAYFGTYQTVKNAVEIAGFEQIDIILKPS